MNGCKWLRLFVIAASAFMVFGLTACGGSGGQVSTAQAGKPLLSEGSEIDLIKISEAVWAREAAVGANGLTPAEKVFLRVWNLEAEVNNGGFNQYYQNSAGDHALETPAALREIGASEAASLVESANQVFGPTGPSRDRDERTRALEQLGKSATDALGTLDTRFYEYPDNLSDLLRRYVDQNRAHFHAVS